MRDTQQERRRLMNRLTELLEELTPEDRQQMMADAIQTFATSGLFASEWTSVIRRDEPTDFAMDLIGDNSHVLQRLNLTPQSVFQRAMKARDALQLVQTLA
jgi:uncharacterized membrane protein